MYVFGLVLAGLIAVAAGWRVSHTVVYSAIAIPIVSYASIRVMECVGPLAAPTHAGPPSRLRLIHPSGPSFPRVLLPRAARTELRIWKSLHPLVLSIVRRTVCWALCLARAHFRSSVPPIPQRGSKLRKLRRSLQKEVRTLVQTMGPQVFEDWESRKVGGYTWPPTEAEEAVETEAPSATAPPATTPSPQHSVDTGGLRARR